MGLLVDSINVTIKIFKNKINLNLKQLCLKN